MQLAGLFRKQVPWLHKATYLNKLVRLKIEFCNSTFFIFIFSLMQCSAESQRVQSKVVNSSQNKNTREKVINHVNHRSHYSVPTLPAASQCQLRIDVGLRLKYQCLESSYFKENRISLIRLDIQTFMINSGTTGFLKEKANSRVFETYCMSIQCLW